MALADRIRRLAAQKTVLPAQLALAWLLARGDDVVPIFGTRKRANLEANVRAADIQLAPSELAAIDQTAPRGAVAGERWAPEFMAQLNR